MGEQRDAIYQSYLLRLWRTDPDALWRASLTDPQTGATRYFASVDELLAFLRAQTGEAPRRVEEQPGNGGSPASAA